MPRNPSSPGVLKAGPGGSDSVRHRFDPTKIPKRSALSARTSIRPYGGFRARVGPPELHGGDVEPERRSNRVRVLAVEPGGGQL